MPIRKATRSDLESILPIYSYAREQMKQNGNPNQWGDTRPSVETIKKDIENNNLYLIESDGQIDGVFFFFTEEEPTYQQIEGSWLNDLPYGTIHRVAAGRRKKGVLKQCLDYCASLIPNIRMDTHECNVIMQRLLEKNGFKKCGVIYVEDGTPRLAYQRTPERTPFRPSESN